MFDFINTHLVHFFSNYNIYYSAIIAYATYAIIYFTNISETEPDFTITLGLIHVFSHLWFLTCITKDNNYIALTPIIYAILFYIITIFSHSHIISFFNRHGNK